MGNSSTNTVPLGTLADQYSQVLNRIEEIEAGELRDLKARKQELASEIMENMEAAGIPKLSTDLISLSVGETRVAKITGDWDAVAAELVSRGMGYALTRKLSGSKLAEAFENGERLPAGIELDTIRRLNHRRK